jgi:hypothetical protein
MNDLTMSGGGRIEASAAGWCVSVQSSWVGSSTTYQK